MRHFLAFTTGWHAIRPCSRRSPLRRAARTNASADCPFRRGPLQRFMIAQAVREHPRRGFKKAFTEAFRQEAARVPQGRAQLLLHYGALAAAIRFAPFSE